MKNQQIIKSLIIAPIVAALVGLAGAQNGQLFNGLPIFVIGIAVAFLINWIAFFPANLLQTEKFFDLTGSCTYILVTVMALSLSDQLDNRSMLLGGLVIIWALRLGSFLFKRVLQDGKDVRFDKIKPNPLRFFNVWTLQALWVSLTAAAALMAITSTERKPLGIIAIIGLVVWIIGFLLEVVADYQKRQFRKNPANKGKFIQTGLWSKSRHPNYFGEALLWWGIFLFSIPSGGILLSLISPVLITFLLLKVSGVVMLEKKLNLKPDFIEYKRRTNAFVPWFPRE